MIIVPHTGITPAPRNFPRTYRKKAAERRRIEITSVAILCGRGEELARVRACVFTENSRIYKPVVHRGCMCMLVELCACVGGCIIIRTFVRISILCSPQFKRAVSIILVTPARSREMYDEISAEYV